LANIDTSIIADKQSALFVQQTDSALDDLSYVVQSAPDLCASQKRFDALPEHRSSKAYIGILLQGRRNEESDSMNSTFGAVSLLIGSLVVLICIGPGIAGGGEIDTDRDGLADFHEKHKYFTNPASADSDGDSVPDGDWHERREYTYTIRSVVKVMRPCDVAVANDDYQDARVLSETDNYVELEVIHYPFNTNAAAIVGSLDWQNPVPEVQPYLQAGITTNWDEAMRSDLIAELKNDGIDLSGITDKHVVERVARWLLARGKYRDQFGTYFVHFPNGRAEILPGLEEAFRTNRQNGELPFDQHMEREVYGKGMFENKCYGTCTSTAIYLTTALRAVGIPTRMVLAIPPIDGADSKQVRLIDEQIAHHKVRRTLRSGVYPEGFAAHTFNEVYVGGRWRRLNYNQLGQNSYGSGAMGMLTHVLTFADLSEAGLAQTWGKRHGLQERDTTFQYGNPYRTTELSDRFGIHASIENPSNSEPKVAPITKAYWYFSAERPASIPAESVKPGQDGHLLVHVDLEFADLKAIYPKLDRGFLLTAEGQPTVRAQAERGFWNMECYLRIPAEQFASMTPGVPYQLTPAKTDAEFHWLVRDGVSVIKPKIKNPSSNEPQVAPITKAYWYFSAERPASIPADGVKPEQDGHLLARVELELEDLKTLYPKLDGEFLLTADGQPTVRAQAGLLAWNTWQPVFFRLVDQFIRPSSPCPLRC
jgi:hypothetical protein